MRASSSRGETVRAVGQQAPELLPRPHAVVQPGAAQELVGRVQILVGRREREEQGLRPQLPLEQRGRRERPRDAGQQHLLAGVHRLQRGGGRGDRRVAGRDGVGRHPGLVRGHRDPHPGRRLGPDVRRDGVEDVIGVLARHQPAGHVPDGDVRDHGVLPAAPDAVDLQGRPLPQALQGAEPRIAPARVEPELAQVARFVKRNPAYLGAALRGQRRDAVVETVDRDRPVGRVQAGQQRAQGVQRVGHGAAVPTGVQVAAGTLHRDIQAHQSLGHQRQRRLTGPPHGSVGRYHQVSS
jgi:hypothetical protein